VNFRTVVSLALLAFALIGVPKSRTPDVLASISEPTQEMKAVVKPVAKVVQSMSITDRLWLQSIYMNCARVVAADGIVEEPVVTSTEGLRAVHVAVLAFIWKGMAGNSPEKYPGLATAIDEALNSVVSGDSRQLTPELRQKAVDIYTAIAWAGLGKDG
jgi:hypothetical protein